MSSDGSGVLVSATLEGDSVSKSSIEGGREENTGEEIKDAVQEMLLFLSKNNLDDIGYLSAREKIVFALESPVDVGSTSKPSMSFLNRHQSLLTLQEN